MSKRIEESEGGDGGRPAAAGRGLRSFRSQRTLRAALFFLPSFPLISHLARPSDTTMPALHNKHPPSFASPSPPLSFPLFTLLPPELATRILLLACRSPSPTDKHPSKRSSLSLDIPTTLSLTLICKSIDKIITPLLYSAVRITRPSALLEILNTLEERSDLGKMIRHLHVGDEYTLYQDDHDWPLVVEHMEDAMRLDYPVLWLKTSWVASDEEEGKLPRWCEPGRSWCLEPWRLDCRGRAVVGMIEKAMQGVDVQPYRRGYAKSGKKIGVVSRDLHEAAQHLDLISLTPLLLLGSPISSQPSPPRVPPHPYHS